VNVAINLRLLRKFWEILELPSDGRLLKKGSASWSYLFKFHSGCHMKLRILKRLPAEEHRQVNYVLQNFLHRQKLVELKLYWLEAWITEVQNMILLSINCYRILVLIGAEKALNRIWIEPH
jgi:hypothetical protein